MFTFDRGPLCRREFILLGFCFAWMVGLSQSASCQDGEVAANNTAAENTASDNTEADQVGANDFTPAIDVLPDTVAGLVRVPSVPKFCEAWKKTNFGRLLEEPSMQPFIDAQRDRAKSYLESIGNKVGVRIEDIYEIGSGEAVFAWLPYANDKRRPFALCVISDIRGRRAQADDVLAALDKDLKAGNWNRNDVQHRGQTVRVYSTTPKPGQLKIEQIAITLDDARIIAADRDSVVTELLDALAGQPAGQPISKLEEFRTVLTRSARAIRGPAVEGGATPAIEWFAKPFEMGRIVRESLDINRGNEVDILQLLENQGFDAIEAAGGIAVMSGDKFDLLHKGFVLAPPTATNPPDAENPSKYTLAARMLQFFNEPIDVIPDWVHADVAALTRVNLRIEPAFWAVESLVNEAFGDEIFREIIDGIRDDEDGPQIDLEKNVLPNLDDHVLMLTDSVMPADINSERLLVAIRVKNAATIKKAIAKAMEVEPDASKMDVLPGVEIWRVQRSASVVDIDAEIFGDFEIQEEDADQPPPLLDQWAIALVDQGPGSTAPFLMFSSHPELLVQVAKRIQAGAKDGLASDPEVKKVLQEIGKLEGQSNAVHRIVRTKLSFRVKYELLRQGKLKESDTLLASLYRRFLENEDGGEPEPLNAGKLPPLAQIEPFLPAGGTFVEETQDGWNVTGFFLK